jgi:CRISPR-associated protein Cmr1
MFLAGADGEKPELRTPSIKGAMRFWWRAMHAYLPIDCKNDNEGNGVKIGLRNQETEIFGGGGEYAKKSSFSLRILTNIQEMTIKEEKPLPHHTGQKNCKYLMGANNCKGKKDDCKKGFPKGAISKGLFEVNFTGGDLERLQKLFVLTCLLGGFGKRSRRGFGSVIITGRKMYNEDEYKVFDMPKTLKEIYTILSVFNTDYRLDDSNKKIYLEKPETLNDKYSEYPYIEEIQIGNKPYSKLNEDTCDKYPGFELVEFIGQTTHRYFDINKSNGAGKPRFASPTYVSALKAVCVEQQQNETVCYYPIITTLHYAPPNEITDNSDQLKADFKNAILEKNST